MEDSRILEEYAIKFLLYSYFSISLKKDEYVTCEDETKDIIMKIIHKAYSDATQQGAYNTKVKEISKQAKEAAKKDATETIYSFITETLPKLENYDSYDDYHSDLCNGILRCYKDIENDDGTVIFTYGNAQKWVNMTMKYLLIIHSIFSKYRNDCHFETTYGKIIDGLKPYFHVPIDSYIIEKVWKDCKESLPITVEKWKPLEKRLNDECPKPSDKVKGWSNWYEDEYKAVQKDIKEIAKKGKKIPIIWEGDAWIEIAEKRAKREQRQ